MHVTDLHRRSVEGFAARVDALDGLSARPMGGPDAVRRLGRPGPAQPHRVRGPVDGARSWRAPPSTRSATATRATCWATTRSSAARAACDMAVTAAASGIVAGQTVHLSFGDVPAEEYAHQLAADHIIHGWDLAVATGGDTSMDPEMVEALAAWFAGQRGGLPQRRRHRRAPRGGRGARRRVGRAAAGLRPRPRLAPRVAPAPGAIGRPSLSTRPLLHGRPPEHPHGHQRSSRRRTPPRRPG